MTSEVCAIVAVGPDMVIGIKDKLLWKSKQDFMVFKYLTNGYPCIFGSTTYNGLPKKPLKDRLNIVIDGDKKEAATANFGYSDLNTACKGGYVTVCKPELALFFGNNFSRQFICGGASIYKYFIESDVVDTLYITEISSPKIIEEMAKAKKEDLVYFPITYQKLIELGYKQVSILSEIDELDLPKEDDEGMTVSFSKWVKDKE